MDSHRLSRRDARRIAVRAQLLDAHRPTEVVATVRHLTLLQLDPTAAVAPNADLVLWSRLGNTYDPADLVRALELDRSLIEHDARILPSEDLSLYRAEMALPPTWQRRRAWLEQNAAFVDDILGRLRSDGPLLSRDIEDTAAEPWASTGWSNDRNVSVMLEVLAQQGLVAVAARQGRQRVWDIAERVHPVDLEDLPLDEAAARRDARRLRALGIARARTTRQPVEPSDVGLAGEPAVVAGVRGAWRVDPRYLDGAPFRGRTALLSPFDRLVHDRVRAEELFGFTYILEMYKPAAQRRWGYFALPILRGDRLIGKLDARGDRKRGVFEVFAIHEDEPFSAAASREVRAEIAALATWLDLELAYVQPS